MTILFYWLLIQLIMNVLFKVDRSFCSCGVIGFAPKTNLTEMQRQVAYTKVKIIAMYNQERGGDGCGMLINGEVYKGYDDWKSTPKKNTKAWKDFFADPEISMLSYEKGVIIAHTRKGTMGGTDKENNHPFTIEPSSGDPRLKLHGVHNGTISNMLKLCTKHEVDYNSWKVDSHGLYILLDKVGLEVLTEYEGYAALVWTVEGEPNSLYVYHGAYCEYKDEDPDKVGVIVERPMFFMETPEGIYLSSMEEPLKAIASKGEEPVELNWNCVYQIKNGKWTKFQYKIDRLKGPNCKDRPVTTYKGNSQMNRQPGVNGRYHGNQWVPFHYYGDDYDENAWKEWQEDCNANNCNNRNLINRANNIQQGAIPFLPEGSAIPKESLIWTEAPPHQSKAKRVYYHKGRYWNALLGENTLASGKLWLDKKGYVFSENSTGTNAKEYWFYKGIMIKSGIAHSNLITQKTMGRIDSPTDKTTNFAAELSFYATYPVTNYWTEALHATPYLRFGYYLDGKRCANKSFSPLFSSRNYVINRYGYLETITTSDKNNDSPIFIRPQQDFIIVGKKSKVYDTIFTDLSDAMSAISQDQMYAMLFFCLDYMTKGSSLDPDELEVHQEVEGVILAAIARGCTIRTEIEDAGNILETLEDRKVRIDRISLRLWKKESIKRLLGLEVILPPVQSSQVTIDPNAGGMSIADKLLAESEIVEEADENVNDGTEPQLEDPDSDSLGRDVVEIGISEMIVILGDLNNNVDDLAQFTKDDYAQELTDFMYKTLDNIKHKIADLANENQDIKNANLINKTINSAVI